MIKMTYKELYLKYKQVAIENNKEDTAIKLLIQELSNFSSTEFYLNLDKKVDSANLEKILVAIDDYLNKGIPIQYILGYTYFYGYKLIVNKNVLIPRRETEELVDYIIHNSISNPRILDIGTGSGAIAISLKSSLKDSNVVASDISNDALEIAKLNAKINNQTIEFIESDIFSNIEGKFDIITSNPPYISKRENVDELVYNNEPHLALFANEEGLYFYRKILEDAYKYLNEKFLIIFEIPEDKDKELTNLVKISYPNSDFEIKKDLQGKSRMLIIRNNWR